MLMKALGLGINTMTLGGLVVAIGSVVDDAIVDMENCYRGLRENQAAGNPKAPLQVVFETAVEVRQPVLFSSLIIIVVFAPIFSLTGVEGRIFAPMGLAYLFSIAASSLVALTLIPALCAILLAPVQLPAESTWMAERAEGLYKPWLGMAMAAPRRVLAVALALAVFSAARYYTVSWLGEHVTADVRQQVYGHVIQQSPVFFETTHAGEVLSRLGQDATLIHTVVGSSLSMGLRNLVMGMGALLMLVWTNPWMMLKVAAVLLAVVLPSVFLGRRVRRLSRASQDRARGCRTRPGRALSWPRCWATCRTCSTRCAENRRPPIRRR